LGSSWLVLFLLPKPTPRIPLFAARCLAFVTTIAAASIGLDWLAKALPLLQPWKGLLWFVLMSGLLVWAFMALRPRVPASARAGSSAAPVQDGCGDRWANVPNFGFSDVGGQMQVKEEIRAVAGNRFSQRSPSVVRNGILLYGPQGTGKQRCRSV
jgi:hypothetical protein